MSRMAQWSRGSRHRLQIWPMVNWIWRILPAKPRSGAINVMALTVRLALVSASDLANGEVKLLTFTSSGHTTASSVLPVNILAFQRPFSEPICRCWGPSSPSSWRLPATPSQVVRPRRRSCWKGCGAEIWCAVQKDSIDFLLYVLGSFL